MTSPSREIRHLECHSSDHYYNRPCFRQHRRGRPVAGSRSAIRHSDLSEHSDKPHERQQSGCGSVSGAYLHICADLRADDRIGHSSVHPLFRKSDVSRPGTTSSPRASPIRAADRRARARQYQCSLRRYRLPALRRLSALSDRFNTALRKKTAQWRCIRAERSPIRQITTPRRVRRSSYPHK